MTTYGIEHNGKTVRVTAKQINALREMAIDAGDVMLAAQARAALEGDEYAQLEVACMLSDAREENDGND
jgi:hypothetical protein